jgi:hypothetical protein
MVLLRLVVPILGKRQEKWIPIWVKNTVLRKPSEKEEVGRR